MPPQDVAGFFAGMNEVLAEVRQQRGDRLRRFFEGLAPRLETARVLDAELDRQLARRFNALDYLRTDEMGLSRIVADLLDRNGNHGQGTTFLRRFVECVSDFIKAPASLDRSSVAIEQAIDAQRRIDVLVHLDEQHAIAIENKPFAGDQPGQVKDYLCWLKKTYNTFLLVYLSPTGEGPSRDSVKIEHLEETTKKNRRFAIMSYAGNSFEEEEEEGGGDEEEAERDRFERFRLKPSLADWLAACRRDCDVDRLRWFFREVETFCTRTFGGERVGSSEMEAVKDFVLRDAANTEAALAIYEAWPSIKNYVGQRFLGAIGEQTRATFKEKDWTYQSQWKVAGKRQMVYVDVYRKSWSCRVRLQAHNTAAPSGFYIGVVTWSEEKDSVLADAFADIEGRIAEKWWPWWNWVDKYSDWRGLVHKLHVECEEGKGEIMDYFVGKFREVAEFAVPIIDEIEGKPSSSG